MKKTCFVLFLAAALVVFFLFSCRKAGTLRDALTGAVFAEETLPVGSVFCYGRMYEDGAAPSLVCDFLCGTEEEVAANVEDFAVYASLPDAQYELLLCRMYRVSDVADMRRALERRADESCRALSAFGTEVGETTVAVYGNIIALYRMPDNAAAERAVKAAL